MSAPARVADGVDVVVVGAGVVGLASAAALASAGRGVVVLERAARIATATTSRNSGVLHAGLYYPPGSLAAHACVEGRALTVARCRERGIDWRETGKLVVACAPDEVPRLEALAANARACGAPDVELVDAAFARAREPHVRAVAALWSPRTGIVDAVGLAASFAAEAEASGAACLTSREVVGLARTRDGWRVDVREPDGARGAIAALAVVDAAGLEADRVAALAGIDVDAAGLRLHPCKGSYFALAPGAPLAFCGLVYPLPGGGGLGVHATLDLGGRVRFGPDAEYVAPEARDDVRVDPAKAAAFARAIARYAPGIREEWLAPDDAGVRPKLAGPGEPFRDFVVREESAHGAPGFVSCVGIESPGLTAAASLARRVAALLASL